jgi:hypothetical protein
MFGDARYLIFLFPLNLYLSLPWMPTTLTKEKDKEERER